MRPAPQRAARRRGAASPACYLPELGAKGQQPASAHPPRTARRVRPPAFRPYRALAVGCPNQLRAQAHRKRPSRSTICGPPPPDCPTYPCKRQRGDGRLMACSPGVVFGHCTCADCRTLARLAGMRRHGTAPVRRMRGQPRRGRTSNFEESRREIWPKACERHRVGRASHLNDDMPSLGVARPAIISRQLVKRDGCGPATQSTPTAETLCKTIHNYRKAGRRVPLPRMRGAKIPRAAGARVGAYE